MNLRHLEHLLALADTGSFSKAAARACITQSALSRSIRSLEEELGGRLLDRIGKRNELTPLGLEIVARARRIVHETQELRRSAELLQDGVGIALRVGLGSGPAALLGRPLLSGVAALHPRVSVSIEHGPTELQLMQLRTGQLDALVVDARRVAPAPDLQVERLPELGAGFVCRADHPLAARARLTLEELLQFPLASTPLSDEVARHLVDQYGPQAHPAQMVTLRSEDIASLIACVEQTDAVCLCILAAAREGLDSGRLRVLDLRPALKIGARFACITLAGRTEALAMPVLRRLIAERLRD